ncbi:sensor histidine kinase [Streptosporangium lutulentum]
MVIGVGLDLAIRTKIEDGLFQESLRAATYVTGWQAGSTSHLTPKARIDLLQLVDSHGRVLAASPEAASRPFMSTLRPPLYDPVQHRTECSPRSGCVVLTALRIPPLETRVFWQGEPHYVLAGTAQPPLLAEHLLELFIAAGVALIAALATWGTWWTVGRALDPVRAIRARMAEITVTDLSLRVPQPPGCDEIAQLAHTANQTLARLEESATYQRHFASVASHELKNPVAGLQTQLEEALLYPDDVDPRDTIRTSLSTTERLRAIIDDLLSLARVQTVTPAPPEPIDLGALVRDEASARVGDVPVRVRTHGEVKVLGNRIQLIGILSNLLFNAQRHAATIVEVTAAGSDGQAVVTVTDDGDGIAPKDRERVFEPFVRLSDGRRRDPKGNGLGLAISRTAAEVHRGSLRIEDSARGARFVLRLPLMDADRPPARS